MENFKKEALKRHGALMIAWTLRYKDHKHFMPFQRIFSSGVNY